MKILSVALCALILSGCCTDVDNIRQSIPITYSLQNAEIPLGNSFDLEVIIPEVLESVDGILTNVSDVDFGFRINFYTYTEDENLGFWEFPEADNDFEILQEDTRDEFGVFRNLEEVNNDRRFVLTLSPSQVGTYVLAVACTGGRDTEIRACAPYHEMSIRNDDLPIEQNFPNIDVTISNLSNGQEQQGLLLFRVI